MRRTTELIVALDTKDLRETERLLKELRGLPLLYKIGSSLFTLAGPKAVDLAHKYGGKVFLDLKLHDIPNTVKNAVANAGKLGVYSISVHISGGADMLRAASELERRPKLWGITVLTSFDEKSFAKVGFRRKIAPTISALAALGAGCGIDGIVCSPLEASSVKKKFGQSVKVITPGIRPAGPSEDQKRTLTPALAKKAGADFIVVGRPILMAKDPALAARGILEELSK